jgi:hypothetical protein
MTAVATRPHVPVATLRPDLRPSAAAAIEAALRKTPDERPPDIAALTARWSSHASAPRASRPRGRAGHLSLLVRPTRRPTPSHLRALVRPAAPPR